MESIYSLITELEKEGKGGVLCTIIKSHGSTPRHAGSKMLVFPDGQSTGSVGGGEIESRVIQEALDAYLDGKPRVLDYKLVDPEAGDPGICGGSVEVYIEPILPRPVVLIIGGGHVGKVTCSLAKWLGFRVVVSDDRIEFCSKQFVPDADEFYPVPMQELPGIFEITPHTFVVLTTRGSNVDIEGIAPILESPAKYIGVIGSKRRWLATRKGLIARSVSVDRLDKISSPMGLELGAETPEEIAVSIMAEIIMVRNGGTGKSMKYHPSNQL
jgi:xanthine dehydrogenase accessory factor